MGPVELVNALLHQWHALVFLVLPLYLMAYNHVPDPIELTGCFISRFWPDTVKLPDGSRRRAVQRLPSSMEPCGTIRQKSWSWESFKAAIARDKCAIAAGKTVNRPMTESKAQIIYALFGHERIPFKQH
eukprot:TRINITY_DN52791_c0_g1_i2.p1 TRINITY_DN52791_c0_g1~~TRINITY_DN52791_c0_g1_i2.p1  ORF type:complete len:129 (-),score=13.07 TRINITY_DN52791_c0_g1_i2:76-462(-)